MSDKTMHGAKINIPKFPMGAQFTWIKMKCEGEPKFMENWQYPTTVMQVAVDPSCKAYVKPYNGSVEPYSVTMQSKSYALWALLEKAGVRKGDQFAVVGIENPDEKWNYWAVVNSKREIFSDCPSHPNFVEISEDDVPDSARTKDLPPVSGGMDEINRKLDMIIGYFGIGNDGKESSPTPDNPSDPFSNDDLPF